MMMIFNLQWRLYGMSCEFTHVYAVKRPGYEVEMAIDSNLSNVYLLQDPDR